MSELTRRDLFRGAAALVSIEPAAAARVHQAVAEEKQATGAYRPKCFNDHEYKTLTKLAGMIVPGALDGGAPEYIDLLASNNAELATIYTGGLAWLDHESERRSGAVFLEAKPEAQAALLELIAYRENDSPELGPGIRFFDWARKMVVDAYFTSKPGIEYLGYEGNTALPSFEVPQAVLDYVLKRAG